MDQIFSWIDGFKKKIFLNYIFLSPNLTILLSVLLSELNQEGHPYDLLGTVHQPTIGITMGDK